MSPVKDLHLITGAEGSQDQHREEHSIFYTLGWTTWAARQIRGPISGHYGVWLKELVAQLGGERGTQVGRAKQSR
jgi:hypothetical protein